VDFFARIAALYEDDLRIPSNNVCRLRCDARTKRPLLPWHVGDRFAEDPLRLVIIGKPHREDEPTVDRPGGTQDGRATADRLFRTKPWPFWRYTRELLRRLHGSEEEGWSRTALTTLVKCSNAKGGAEANDRTTPTMKACCIGDLGVVRQELAILEPRTVILYTGRPYDAWVKGLCWRRGQSWRDVTSMTHIRRCGDVPLPWWEGEMSGSGPRVRVLRLGHPQGKPLQAYVTLLTRWISGPA
jgi:hypothetical protein